MLENAVVISFSFNPAVCGVVETPMNDILILQPQYFIYIVIPIVIYIYYTLDDFHNMYNILIILYCSAGNKQEGHQSGKC